MALLKVFLQKVRSLFRYIRLFSNWWIPCSAAYLAKAFPGRRKALLCFRDGRRLYFRPSSDFIALGEIFIAENYQKAGRLSCPELVWDIGGNIGMFVLDAYSRCPQARYVSFEPCQPTFSILAENLQINPAIRWEIHPFGFGRANEVRTACVPRNLFGETSIFCRDGAQFPLLLRRPDEFWEQAGRPAIGLFKVDCEGAEFEIFETMSHEMFAAIDHIIVEIHPVPGKTADFLLQLIIARGFDIQTGMAPLYYASRSIRQRSIS